MKGKNKLVPRLLGITKDSVMRVDEKTKEVLQEWPLTTVKRWAASPKSFTLVRTVRGQRGGQHGLGLILWDRKNNTIPLGFPRLREKYGERQMAGVYGIGKGTGPEVRELSASWVSLAMSSSLVH